MEEDGFQMLLMRLEMEAWWGRFMLVLLLLMLLRREEEMRGAGVETAEAPAAGKSDSSGALLAARLERRLREKEREMRLRIEPPPAVVERSFSSSAVSERVCVCAG